MDNYQLSDDIIITYMYIAYERRNFCYKLRGNRGARKSLDCAYPNGDPLT